jgi:hypothetical protein
LRSTFELKKKYPLPGRERVGERVIGKGIMTFQKWVHWPGMTVVAEATAARPVSRFRMTRRH